MLSSPTSALLPSVHQSPMTDLPEFACEYEYSHGLMLSAEIPAVMWEDQSINSFINFLMATFKANLFPICVHLVW